MKVNFFKNIFSTYQANSNNISHIKSKYNLKALIKRNNLNHKHFSLPAIALASSFIFLCIQEKLKSNSLYCITERQENNNCDKRSLLGNKFIILDHPSIYIIYDQENQIQSECAEMIYNNLQQNYLNFAPTLDFQSLDTHHQLPYPLPKC